MDITDERYLKKNYTELYFYVLAMLSAGSTVTVISTAARDCQALMRQLRAKHKQIALQLIPGHCQIAENELADALIKKGAKITQIHIRETPYQSI